MFLFVLCCWKVCLIVLLPYDGRLVVEASYGGSAYSGLLSEYSFEFFEGGTTLPGHLRLLEVGVCWI